MGLRPELLEKTTMPKIVSLFLLGNWPKNEAKRAIQKEYQYKQFPRGPENVKNMKKEKKKKKLFATFPFKGCKPPRYHMKIAYIRIRVTMPPKHQPE